MQAAGHEIRIGAEPAQRVTVGAKDEDQNGSDTMSVPACLTSSRVLASLCGSSSTSQNNDARLPVDDDATRTSGGSLNRVRWTTGLDLCRAVRKDSSVPIIMLTARGSETDRVLGLKMGADDYVPKPFSRAELLARIRAVLRRGRAITEVTTLPPGRHIWFANWRLDTGRRELFAPGGESVDLSAAEYDVLLAFLENPQRVLTRDRILELSRARRGDMFDRSVDVLISRLRRKLDIQEDAEASASELSRTLRGADYMVVPDVTQ